ncbi:class I SAM-dependent methyltransferase [Bacillus sp. SM2101]|uniref:class I SAM-dependent methyltransferase n=1 Tax=Bacillus sp. SM2101 TaxID=2805366 RepID=UPI001BDE34F9|nr:class I SAM-dependent methyltransferase [Bacillus sp. SM2101]
MGDHYFTDKPKVNSNPQTWSYELKGFMFSFITDNGVFSKSEVDFGSKLLIQHFEPSEADGSILDIGCGYGPIGLSIAKAFHKQRVEMVDVNERALELAEKNKQLNGVSNVTIYKSDLFEGVNQRSFSAILSNPPIRAGKKVVHTILEESLDYLDDGGELWVVIQKKQGAPSAVEKLKAIFREVEIVTKKKGYYIIKAKKS